MKKKLPYKMDSVALAYHYMAFPTSVLHANLGEGFNLWVCDRMINYLYAPRGWHVFTCYEENMWPINQGFVKEESLKFQANSLDFLAFDLIAFQKSMLRNNRYITGFYNEYYIPAKKAYQSYDFKHDYILIGYDDKKRCFLSAGYVKNGQYEVFDIAYEDYYLSVRNLDPKFDSSFCYISLDGSYQPQINILNTINAINSYLSSKSWCYHAKEDEIYGISACDMFGEYILQHEDKNVDIRYCRSFMEHKQIMFIRIRTMFEQGFLVSESLVQEYSKIHDEAQMVYLLSLKYNIAKNKNILERVAYYVKKICSEEQWVLTRIVTQAENLHLNKYS